MLIMIYSHEWLLLSFQLLSKPKYSAVEKIKTIGATYMAASGLSPGKNKKRVSISSIPK